MMNAILTAVVRFWETVVNYSLAALLIALVVGGAVALYRWLVSERGFGGPVTALRRGSSSPALVAVLVVALAVVLAGIGLGAR